MNIKAVLFDLDGTLINNDRNRFGAAYMELVYRRFPRSIPFGEFAEALHAAFTAMTKNDGRRTNKELFKETFFPSINFPVDRGLELFDEAHKHDFPGLEDPAEKIPEAKPVVDTMFQRGLKVVVATNPIFPKEVIYERLRWAGVEQMPFDLVTSYENSRYAKPNPLYFKAILDTIDVAPEHALMVGDEHWDMTAGRAGIKTFFVKSLASNLDETLPPPTFQGKLSDIPALVAGSGKGG